MNAVSSISRAKRKALVGKRIRKNVFIIDVEKEGETKWMESCRKKVFNIDVEKEGRKNGVGKRLA